jgi:hypothetical protein
MLLLQSEALQKFRRAQKQGDSFLERIRPEAIFGNTSRVLTVNRIDVESVRNCSYLGFRRPEGYQNALHVSAIG